MLAPARTACHTPRDLMCKLRIFLLLLILGGAASAIEIREKRWGFDGRARLERFNILSILVANPDARPFEGQFILEERTGIEKGSGAPTIQPVFLAAGTQRWVQFCVFITRPGSDWTLSWGKGGGEKIDGPSAGPPARVMLLDPQDAFAKSGTIRAFPDDLFPTSVAATDALDSVILDHVPRWEPTRRDVFLDWLRSHGTLHLIRGADGQLPQFPETFALLNTHPRVIRHEVTRSELTESYLAEHGHPAPEIRNEARIHVYGLDQQLLQTLAAITKPQIAWSLIYVLTAAYVIAIGPIHYRISKKSPWLRSLAILVAIVATFAGAFVYAGRRGSGENSEIHTIAIARSLGAGRHDVTQWISAFATEGDTYKLTHAAPANFYSTATDFDSVNGAITNGRDGRFEVDIPLFSTRPFIHRGVLNGDRTEVTVEEWNEDGGRLEKLAIVPGDGFPARISQAWVRYGSLYFPLKKLGSRWVLDGGGEPENTFFSEDDYGKFSSTALRRTSFFFGDEPGAKELENWLDASGKVLIARALGTIDGLQNVVTGPALPAGQAQLFLYAQLPDGFRVTDRRFATQQGRVLYLQEISKP